MTEVLKILVVEDDKSVIEIYNRAIKTHNRTQVDYEFTIEAVNNQQDAILCLSSLDNIYHGAIIDLDLAGKGGEDDSGRAIIDIIKNRLRFPVFVISGTIHNLNEEEKQENDLYRVVDRDDSNFDFIDEFRKIHSTGITDILNRTGKIEEYMNIIYWQHLSTSLKPWIEETDRSNEEKKQSLIRYFIFHLQEYLDLSTEADEEFSDYFPAEFFITGPVKSKMFTGDVFTYNNFKYVVITPACDFGNSKVDRVLCLKINDLNQISDKFISSNMTSSAKKELKPLLTNNKPRYHFIPSLYFKNISHDAGIIDFQNQVSFEYEEVTDSSKVERIATISQPFLKDLIERYSRYYARQGAPNISRKQLEDRYIN